MNLSLINREILASLTRRLARLPYACGMKTWIRRLQRDDCERCKATPKTATFVCLPGTRQQMIVDRADRIGSLFFWLGMHHRHQIRLAQKLVAADGVFLDVGANIGEFSVAMAIAKPFARIIAIEPNAAIRTSLLQNIEINSLGNVMCVPVAFGDASCTQTLYSCDDSALTSLVAFTPTHVATAQVEVCTLDDFVKSQSLNRIDLIKIDVEGYELKVLSGASNSLAQFRPSIILEINSITSKAAGFELTDLFDLLRLHRYRFFVWRNRRWTSVGSDLPTQEDIWAEPEERGGPARKL